MLALGTSVLHQVGLCTCDLDMAGVGAGMFRLRECVTNNSLNILHLPGRLMKLRKVPQHDHHPKTGHQHRENP